MLAKMTEMGVKAKLAHSVHCIVTVKHLGLGVKSIDLLQFHAWTFNDPRYIESLTYLQELVDEGLIKHLGVTNFDTAHLRVAVESGIKIVSNQVCVSFLFYSSSFLFNFSFSFNP